MCLTSLYKWMADEDERVILKRPDSLRATKDMLWWRENESIQKRSDISLFILKLLPAESMMKEKLMMKIVSEMIQRKSRSVLQNLELQLRKVYVLY